MKIGFKDKDGGFYQVEVDRAEDIPEWTADMTQLTEEQRQAEISEPSEPPIPKSVTMRQARLALLAAGKLDAVNAAIRSVGVVAQVEWEYATEVRRDWPLVAEIGAGLEMTDADLDQLFVVAAAL